MRITSGAFRGRPLVTPQGASTRPTADRARQAMFNILEHAPWSPFSEGPALDGVRVIDLFAGSGALGLEALSRGAAFCLFVETAEAARGAIRDNVEALAPDGALFGRTRVHRRDAADLGRRPGGAGEAFDLAFLDPPYRQGLGERALDQLAAGGWLRSGATCVLERACDESDAAPAGYTLLDARGYGAARVAFLRYEGGAPPTEA